MSWSLEDVGVTVAGALLAGVAAVLVLEVLRALDLPSVYASVLGLSVALPLLLYAARSSLRIDAGAYFDARGRAGSALDGLLVVLVGGLGGSAATFVALRGGVPAQWSQSVGVTVAVLAGNAAFIRRNRTYFDGNPWVGGRIGEWLDE